VPGYSVDYFHMNSEPKIRVVIHCSFQPFNDLVHYLIISFSLNLPSSVCFIRLGGEKDVSRVKRGDGIKKFEKDWSISKGYLWYS